MNRREICLAAAIGALHPGLASQAAEANAAASPAGNPDLAKLTLAQASDAIRGRTATSRELTTACLARIGADNPKINALITVMRERALAQADVLDAEAKANKFRSPLHGIPIALKDAIDTAGTRTTAASAQYAERVPEQDAHVVQRLRQAGAVILAKSNLAEFSLSPTSASSHFGPVRNPWAHDRVSGGSSGGSAAALATHMCFGALGTDSGGSVRLPAAWCGIVGLKPTDGLVSNSGIIPSVPILDSCGPMARTVEDVALLFGQMVGFDALDTRSVERPAENYAVSARQPVSQLRVGVPRKPFFHEVDPQIANSVEQAMAVLAKLTRGLKDVAFPPSAEPADLFINAAEACTYHQKMLEQQADLYTPMTRKVLQWCVRYIGDPAQGTASAKLARYIQARERLERQRRTIDTAFTGFDVLVLPTMKSLPPTIDAALQVENSDSIEEQFSIENTALFNVLGLPSISVPCGFSATGLPIGLMICGPRFSEGRLLAVAAAYQQSTEWHQRALPRAEQQH
jgi:aspartyl-tRNA(Asn)/glutamyl-tRNA(Gln) amidotransferase subunit A